MTETTKRLDPARSERDAVPCAATFSRRVWAPLLAVTALAISSGCSGPQYYDYGAYLERHPQSILVLPPLNRATDIEASDGLLSTFSTPLGEYGYYVFPIALVDRMFKDNGAPTPYEMHQIPPAKLREVFGADAALYIVIENWSTTYIVLNTTTTVTIRYELLDLETGESIWEQRRTVSQSSGGGGGGNPVAALIGMAISAAVDAAVSAMSDRERLLAIQAHHQAFGDRLIGLLPGHHHPRYEEARQEVIERERAKATE